MTQVSRTGEYDIPADQLWAKIGDFSSVGWHPAVANTEADGDKRTLTLADGAQIVESKVAEGERSYSYAIEESPLPVAGYEATIAVEENGSGSRVTWSASFEPAGASEEEAEAAIGGIFDAGLAAL